MAHRHKVKWKRFSKKKKRRLAFKFAAWFLSIVADCLITYALTKLLG